MKNFKIELRWSLLYSLFLLGWMFIESDMGWHDAQIQNETLYHFIAVLLLYILAITAAMREKRKNYYERAMTWKEGFICGAMLAVLVTILSPMVQFFIYHYISPDYFQNMIEYQVSKGMPESSAKQLYSMKFYIIQAVFTDLSFGLFFSAIIALFFKNKAKKQ